MIVFVKMDDCVITRAKAFMSYLEYVRWHLNVWFSQVCLMMRNGQFEAMTDFDGTDYNSQLMGQCISDTLRPAECSQAAVDVVPRKSKQVVGLI